MFKTSRKYLLGAAVLATMTAGGFAKADSHSHATHFIDHEFVSYETGDLNHAEKLELNRYLNYEHREPCQNYRAEPAPFHREGCDLYRHKLKDYTIYFNTDSSNIRGSERKKVRDIANAIKKHNPREVVIIGYTDTQGSAAYNEALSARRADSVAAALEKRGIKARILDEASKGEHNLAVPTKDNVSHQSNRRVTVRLMR